MKKVFKNLMFLTIFLNVSLFIMSQTKNVYAAYGKETTVRISAESAIYFNEEGNFVFSTHDKTATSGIRYKTVGWTIKKYQEPIGADGQISVVIPTPNYFYEIVDKDNPSYKFNYFVMEGEKLLEYINNVSPEWKDYLCKYGGTVYLDSVMTVTEYGVIKGGVDSAGIGYGEVYFDFNGISTARGWAAPECLRDYFDIPVAVPVFINKPEMQIPPDKMKTTEVVLGNSTLVSMEMGSHKKDDEEYDMSLGIPSGEDIYACGMADSYLIEGKLVKNTGMVSIPVKVTTDYVLKWTDLEGVSRSEKVKVNRYYYVQESYEYYTADKFIVYELSKVSLTGKCIGEVAYDISVPEVNTSSESYGDVKNHIQVTEGNVYAGEKVIYSANNRKPDIPDENQEELAKNGGASIKVRNDSLSFGEKVILSSEWTDKGTYSFDMSDEKKTIYEEGIVIDEKASNGKYDDTKAVYKYVLGDEEKEISVSAGALTVHTPVVCSAGITAPKKYNMAAEPKPNQIVAGTDFSVMCKTTGAHREIMGYGEKDYSAYVDNGYVRFPFEVIINNKKYSKNTWIQVKNTGAVCYIPESVSLGDYKIEYAVLAKNSSITDISSAMENGIIGNNANMSLTEYGAVNTVEVQVIGTIRGFSVESDDGMVYVGDKIGFNGKAPDNAGNMPLSTEKKFTECRLKVISCGFGAQAEDNIKGNISYYYIKNGERIEADVYVSGKHDILGGQSYKKMAETVIFGEDKKTSVADGIYQWETTMEFGEYVVVMPKGISPDSEEVVNQYALRGGNILINFDINGYSGKTWEYSYINVENSPKGYCNMWKTEGYKYEFMDKKGDRYLLEDGDGIVIEVVGGIYEDYDVVGTH